MIGVLAISAPEGAKRKKEKTISGGLLFHRRKRLGWGKGTYANVLAIGGPEKGMPITSA